MHAPNFSFVAKPSMLLCHFSRLSTHFTRIHTNSTVQQLHSQRRHREFVCWCGSPPPRKELFIVLGLDYQQMHNARNFEKLIISCCVSYYQFYSKYAIYLIHNFKGEVSLRLKVDQILKYDTFIIYYFVLFYWLLINYGAIFCKIL